MKPATAARSLVLLLVAGAFALVAWQLVETGPQSKRERPPVPTPLVDVIDSTPHDHPLTLEAAGPVTSAYELEIRPQVGGKIVELHADFEPGGRIPAGSTIVHIEQDDYRLAVSAAEADVAKARASIALERGRRVVAREELQALQGSVKVDPSSSALALRRPQLNQVEAELAAAEIRLQRAQLDLARTRLTLPFDVVVLERTRIAGEVVAARELIGRVTRADQYWVELRTQPYLVQHVNARSGDSPGSRVIVRSEAGAFDGEVVRVRADLASGSRLAGLIAAVQVTPDAARRLLLGSYVKAEIAAGEMPQSIAVPRRAVRDNGRIWVVDADELLQVRDAEVVWESAQNLLLAKDTLRAGDRIVVSRIEGMLPGARVRSRRVDPDSGRALAMQAEPAAHD
ncbi:MAG: efflux RND transporter periplasmic adaptor subunit [Chromatiaceae bacterium]|nr:efflux RND transporter periplasmic adaptor subunit [Chromatiaceae bacterium]